jgi:hypothetical protein
MNLAKDLSLGAGSLNVPVGIINESGLASCLFAIKKNPSDAIESVAPVMIHFGRNNYMEFFTYHMRRHFSGENQRMEYISVIHDLAMAVGGT